jgi:hypothetical protein
LAETGIVQLQLKLFEQTAQILMGETASCIYRYNALFAGDDWIGNPKS